MVCAYLVPLDLSAQRVSTVIHVYASQGTLMQWWASLLVPYVPLDLFVLATEGFNPFHAHLVLFVLLKA